MDNKRNLIITFLLDIYNGTLETYVKPKRREKVNIDGKI